MKLALIGYGKMGQMVEQAALREGIEVVTVIDPVSGSRGNLVDADVCVDFADPSAALNNIKLAAAAGIAMVVGTTGWYDHLEEARGIVEEAAIRVVSASNFNNYV